MVTKKQTKQQDEQTTYINPKTDFGFKKIFSTGRHAQARLLHLLKAFLPDLMENVVSVAFLPTEVLGETESEKRVTFDLYCATNNGDLIIVEMQRAPQTFFSSRVITYVCRVISSEVERGDKDCMYSKLTNMEKEEYKKSVLDYYDVQDAMRCVREEGREEGLKEGLMQGEVNAKHLIARNMLAKGLAPDFVAEISGLANAEVLELAKEQTDNSSSTTESPPFTDKLPELALSTTGDYQTV